MVIVLCISLFTTRIILLNLGIEDYGIYNIVGSIVSLFTFLQTAISSAYYRYFAFAIGKDDRILLTSTFRSAVILSILICIIVVILAESIGLFYVCNYLNVPQSRFDAAYKTFQISTVTCVITTLYMPFYSNVISHERMDFFAYLSIFEAISKIIIAILIAYSPYDKLVFYSLLLLFNQIGILIAYIIFSVKKFPILKRAVKIKTDRCLLKKMTFFSGWTLFVSVADLFTIQGINIIINIFFSPVINAARGIAVQIQGAVDQFRGNLQTAFNPQITKRFAIGEISRMYDLMSRSSRYSSYILLIISLPIIFSVDKLLLIWLEDVPDYTDIFVIITLIASIIDGISNPFVTAVSATGDINKFQTFVGIMKLSTLPACYIGVHIYTNPITVFIMYLIFTLLTATTRIWICANKIKMDLKYIIKNMLLPIISFLIISVFICFLLHCLLSPNTFFNLVIYVIISVTLMSAICYFVALNKAEKEYIISFIKTKFHVK